MQKCGWGRVPDELKIYPRLSVSGLMEFHESPAHYESTYILKEKEETRAMIQGTALHCAVLEPDRFHERFVSQILEYPPGTIITAEDAKAHLKDLGLKFPGTKQQLIERLKEANPAIRSKDDIDAEIYGNRQVLKHDEMVACERIVGRIKADHIYSYLLKDGEPEKLGWYFEETTETVITFKADYFKALEKEIMNAQAIVVDVKKVQSVNPRKFEATIWDRNMYIQAALYSDIIHEITGLPTMFLWLAVNASPPYEVAAYVADYGLVEAGRSAYKHDLREWRKCREKGVWPTKHNGLETVSLPAWAWGQIEVLES